MADWNRDGFLEAVVGNFRGGLGFFRTGLPSGVMVGVHDGPPEAIPVPTAYPNPAKASLILHWPVEESYSVEMYGADGRLLNQVTDAAERQTVSLEGLPSGVYFFRLYTRRVFSLSNT
jgi:hypothetical protein